MRFDEEYCKSIFIIIQDDSLWTPLIIAASAGHMDIAKMLLGEYTKKSLSRGSKIQFSYGKF